VSAFHFLKAGGHTDEDREWAERHLGEFEAFEPFVQEWVTPQNCRSFLHFLPQTDWISNPAGRLMVNFVGYFERLDDDFQTIARKIGVSVELQKRNVVARGRKDFRNFYNSETRKIVSRVYERDIRLLGYDFDNRDLPRPGG
jgi:hypothetical protein